MAGASTGEYEEPLTTHVRNEPLDSSLTQTFQSRASSKARSRKETARRCCCLRRREPTPGDDGPGTQPSSHRTGRSDVHVDLPAVVCPAADLERGSGTADLEMFERHTRRWSCLVRWCCPTRSSRRKKQQALEQQQLVTQHLAAITARFFSSAPGTRVWVRGFRQLKAEVEDEDVQFFQDRAPPAERWEALHKVLDLGVSSGVSSGPGVPTSLATSPSSSSPPPLLPVALLVAHFARFATAAYGRGMYMLMKPLTSCLTLGCCTLSEQGGFRRICGVPATDILHANTRAEPFKPTWWLCLDRVSRTVVVAVRGTFGTSDVISDLLVRQVHYRGHSVHQGMLTAARWLRTKLLPLLAGVPQLSSGEFRLVTTGHSLGGGVAALLAWLLREEGSAQDQYLCQSFVYGAPLVCDLALAEKMRRFVVSVVHNKDMVPRMSLRTLEDLRDRISRSAEPVEERLRRYEEVLERFHVPRDPEALARALERGPPPDDSFKTAPDVDRTAAASQMSEPPDEAEPSPPLYGPGWQLHMRRRGLRRTWFDSKPILQKRSLQKFLIAGWTPPTDFFQGMQPAVSMWTDHFPQSYLHVCQVFYERLREAGHEFTGGAAVSMSSARSRGTTISRHISAGFRPDPDGVHIALGVVEQYFGAAYVPSPSPASIQEKMPNLSLEHSTGQLLS